MSDLQCPARFLIARHAEASYETDLLTNDGGSLTPLGRSQSRVLGERLRAERVAQVVCSERARAVQTAEIAAAVLGLGVDVRVGLQEFGVGAAYGTPALAGVFEQPMRAWRAGDLDVRLPEGESGREVVGRMGDVLDDLADRCRGETVLVVSHGGAMVAWLGALAPDPGAGIEIANTALLACERDADGWRLVAGAT